MSESTPKFEGWMGLDRESARGQMVWQSFKPKTWEESDVDIRISHCSVCASDNCVLRSGWRPTPYPCCVGHEIVSIVVGVGSQVKGLEIGDRVGVGPQSDSCRGRVDGHCVQCSTGNEKYCTKLWTGTYAGRYLDGSMSYGGYALHNRVPSHFAVKIPEALWAIPIRILVTHDINARLFLIIIICSQNQSIAHSRMREEVQPRVMWHSTLYGSWLQVVWGGSIGNLWLKCAKWRHYISVHPSFDIHTKRIHVLSECTVYINFDHLMIIECAPCSGQANNKGLE
ncbi:GroES-like protein [Aspergillus uvarum CBS 121591]|uniref:GroES-like protein n=1 Tax=Aspergillus uvarum CBS 121591 TaxID=1448315 RepID=A0A319C1R0_9EURO|nr:GroES-like protein [Aspergillus uvarum CBS 121591]PYH79005.1 GroES-like protein [Aspergillus uvarum CBS 121591]